MKAIVVGDYKSLIHEEALYLKLKERGWETYRVKHFHYNLICGNVTM